MHCSPTLMVELCEAGLLTYFFADQTPCVNQELWKYLKVSPLLWSISLGQSGPYKRAPVKLEKWLEFWLEALFTEKIE